MTNALAMFLTLMMTMSIFFVPVNAKENTNQIDGDIPINETTFPDKIFREYVLEKCDIDKNNSLSQNEINNSLEFYLSNQSISDLTGIEYFTELIKLVCGGNKLTKLDVSHNTKLQNLFCENNSLSSLDVSENTALTRLTCNSNKLTKLDVSKCSSLNYLYCYNNQLTSLITGSVPLIYIGAHTNQLTVLDVSGNKELESLYVSNNQLVEINTSNNLNLESVSCSRNQNLSSLDFSNNLEFNHLEANQCNLLFLDLTNNSKMNYLDAFENRLIGINLAENLNLSFFRATDQRNNTVIADENNSFDMSILNKRFDSNRVSDLSGADSCEKNVLKSINNNLVTYTYNCGSNKTMQVSLNVREAPKIIADDKILAVEDTFNALDNVTASDTEDGDLTDKIEVTYNDVDTSKAGTYIVTYKVTDSGGANTTKTITVIVEKKEIDDKENNDSKDNVQRPNNDKKDDVKIEMTDYTSNTNDISDHDNQKESLPKTDDITNIGLWGMVLLVSSEMLVFVSRKKRNQN